VHCLITTRGEGQRTSEIIGSKLRRPAPCSESESALAKPPSNLACECRLRPGTASGGLLSAGSGSLSVSGRDDHGLADWHWQQGRLRVSRRARRLPRRYAVTVTGREALRRAARPSLPGRISIGVSSGHQSAEIPPSHTQLVYVGGKKYRLRFECQACTVNRPPRRCSPSLIMMSFLGRHRFCF
jgi:hypothetical protein